MSLYLGTNCISAGGSSAFKNNNIGEIITSTIPLSDAGLHLLDGSLISGSGAYSAFVTYIAGLVTDYPDLFTAEADWQSSVSTYGVCGKFVYDSVNNTVRLPKITGFTEGTTDVTALGDLVEAGLPNITGNTGYGFYNAGGQVGGSFYALTSQATGAHPFSETTEYTFLAFNASRSNSIYGNSSTVQPQSIKVLYYIVIATSTKTNIEVDIDEIATDLNGKADVDLTNVNSSGTALASGWAMPSSRYIDLTLGASGATYTAPANGWVFFQDTGNQPYSALVLRTNYIRVSLTPGTNGNPIMSEIMPVKKSDIFYAEYANITGENRLFRFIYAEGEN